MELKSFKQKSEKLIQRIFSNDKSESFENLALDVFNFQYSENSIYRQYVNCLDIRPNNISTIEQIPFIPVEFFKTHDVIVDKRDPEIIFLSSATTGLKQSRHLVADISIYKQSFLNTFNFFFGNPQDYCFLALLPSYMERTGSSLIYMINELMLISQHPDNGYYLNEYEDIGMKISSLENRQQKYILFGVTYALLDFADSYNTKLSYGIVMETGGMKGRRKELIKPEVYDILKNKFKTSTIYSEYGMTELLSQAYSFGDNIFQTPPWMKVLIRDAYDPFYYVENGVSGGINVIDLANLYSCSFIETKDLGKMNQNGHFEVLGRFDNSDIRGCNLLVN